MGLRSRKTDRPQISAPAWLFLFVDVVADRGPRAREAFIGSGEGREGYPGWPVRPAVAWRRPPWRVGSGRLVARVVGTPPIFSSHAGTRGNVGMQPNFTAALAWDVGAGRGPGVRRELFIFNFRVPLYTHATRPGGVALFAKVRCRAGFWDKRNSLVGPRLCPAHSTSARASDISHPSSRCPWPCR